MEIGEPVVLAKLPRAGLSGEGQTKFSQVYGVRDSQRKKRHEVCAAVDGNSLNIFEVVNGRNLASWPIPLDSIFVCPPYSERIVDGEKIYRRSWCATRRRNQQSLQYYEQLKVSNEYTSKTVEHRLRSESAVLKIHPINTENESILVVQEDGSLTTFSADGKSSVFQFSLVRSGEPVTFLATQCATIQQAQNSFLKYRQDLLFALPREAVIVAAAYEGEPENLHVGFWAVVPTPSPAASNTQIEPLLHHDLGRQLLHSDAKKGCVEFSALGKLKVSNASSTTAFNLSSIIPLKTHEGKQSTSERLSSVDLSNELVLYLTSTNLQLLNKSFSATLATTDVKTSSLKRKRVEEGNSLTSLIAYFSHMQRVLAYNASHLLAIDLRSENRAQDAFKQASSLIGNISRGNDRQDRSSRHSRIACSIGRIRQENPTHNWPLVSKELENLVQNKDGDGFQDIFIKTFETRKAKDLLPPVLPSNKADWLLANLFDVSVVRGNSISQILKLKISPEQLLKWCITCGLLNDDNVGHALGIQVQPGAVAQALFDADPELKLLLHYIQECPHLLPQTLASSSRHLVSRALQSSKKDAEQRVIDGGSLMLDGLVLGQDIPARPDELSAGSQVTKCLSYALQRLALTGRSVVSEQLRSFDQTSILALIQFLRQQLFLGGYTRLGGSQHYLSPPPSDHGHETARHNPNPQIPLGAIITVLDGCIDTIGPLGIIGSDVYEAFIQKMVPELLSEISGAALASEDSVFLQGLVRETLRYVESAEKQMAEGRSRVEKKVGGSIAEKGQITTLYAEAEAGESGIVSGSALPLSLKVDDDIDRFKIRKGGEVMSRSAREMGMLKDRLKTAYSFEQLVL